MPFVRKNLGFREKIKYHGMVYSFICGIHGFVVSLHRFRRKDNIDREAYRIRGY